MILKEINDRRVRNMKSEVLADILFILSALSDTVYSNLLIDHSLSFILLSDLDISRSDRTKIIRYADYINYVSDNGFNVDRDKLDVPADALTKIKPFLKKQLVRLIAPPGYIAPSRICIKNPDMNMVDNNKSFQVFFDRYITQKSYTVDTLNLFSEMIDRLYDMDIVLPSRHMLLFLSDFSDFIIATGQVWREIISGLLNNELSQGSDVTRLFKDKSFAITYIARLNRSLIIPPLLYAENNKLIISSAFFDDRTISLLYLLPLFDLAFSHRSVLYKLLYSYMVKT